MMKRDKEMIMEMFTTEAQRFSSDRYNQTSNKPNPKAPKNTLKSSIFAKKRRKITSLNNEIDYYLSSETKEELPTQNISPPLPTWLKLTLQYLHQVLHPRGHSLPVVTSKIIHAIA
ncbi:hypothetical protein MJO28_004391, partial [Puccinia striiformis f. sp. tritici]